MTTLRVMTLNLYFHPHNRWRERQPLISAGLEVLQPDVVLLQEVDREIDGDRQLAGSRFEVLRAREPTRRRYPRHWDGLSILYDPRKVELRQHDVTPLTYHRIAQRVRLRLVGGCEVELANTHLHHTHPRIRACQIGRVVEWLSSPPDRTPIVLAGDLNGTPDEPFYALLRAAGYRSAYATMHGAEPNRTFPSGLQSPGTTPEPDVTIDYIWLRGPIGVERACLALTSPHPDDPRLYPSDHLAVLADLQVRT